MSTLEEVEGSGHNTNSRTKSPKEGDYGILRYFCDRKTTDAPTVTVSKATANQ